MKLHNHKFTSNNILCFTARLKYSSTSKPTSARFLYLYGMLRVLVCLLLVFSYKISVAQIDINLLREIHVHRNTTLDPAFKVITESVTPIAVGVPLVLFTTGLLTHDSITTKKAILIGSSVVIAGVITTALKYSVQRTRPFNEYPDIKQLTPAGSLSFPSGHTSAAFSFATGLSIAYPKWYVIAPSFFWASAAGYSRMHLGVHYPSDVLAGAIIGSGSAYLSYKLNRWLQHHPSHSKSKLVRVFW